MSSQPPPTTITSVFNPGNFVSSTQQESYDANDTRYVRLTTDQSVSGTKTFTGSLALGDTTLATAATTARTITFPDSTGTVALVSSGGPSIFLDGSFTIGSPNLVQYALSQVTLTFSPAFSSTPSILGAVTSGSGGNNHFGLVVSFSSISTSGATLNVYNAGNGTTSGNVIVNWLAYV